MISKKVETHFYLFLACVLLAHFGLLFLNFPSKSKNLLTIPIKVKVIATKKINQIVSSEGPETKVDHQRIKYESDKNRFYERESQARINAKFSKGASTSRKLSLSDLGAFPKGFDPLKKRNISSSNDFLSEVKISDHTQLNTIENKYYGFYQRVRNKLEDFWQSNIHKRVRDVRSDLFTRLKIILSERGELINIIIISSCGIQEFDQAAIDSIKEAAPFHNPPKGLIREGKVSLDWGFIIKT